MKEVGVKLKVGATGLEQIDKLTSELNKAGVSTTALDGKAAELAAELKKLGEQQALIDAFKRQKQAVDDAATSMQAAKAKAGELGREIGATEAPTKKQEAAFAKARAAARDASEAYTAQRVALQTLRTSMASAGVSTEGLAEAQRRVKAELAQAQANMRATADWAQRLATAERAASTQASALAGASAESASALRQTAAAAQQAVSPLEGVGNTLRNVAAVGVAGILGGQTAQMLRSVAETADAYSNLQARIKLVTGEGAAFTSAMEGIAAIALRTNSNLESTGNLFARLAQAGKEIGLGQEAALALTESVNQAVQLSGASATASDAAITQLVQGLQGGVLRGDEFNSVMEQAPRLAQALAAGLGVTTGELRKMAEAGQLSAETVIRALQSQSKVLQQEFGALPATVGRAIENLSTRWKLFIGDLNGATGATASVAGGIDALANNLEDLAAIATRAGAVLVAALAVQAVGALRAVAVQMAATGLSAGVLAKNLNDIPKAINIVVAAVGFEVGFQIGEMLRENSVLARKLGVGITEFLVGVVNDLQFLKEAASAVFTDDTVGAAFDRFKSRAEEQRVIFQGLYEDAEQSPEVVRAAAAAAADETEKLGAKATTAGAQVAAAGAAGAAGLASTTAAAETAAGALQGLVTAATAANKAVAQVGVDAARQAEALVKLALAGGQAAETFRVQLPEAIAKLSGPELEQFRVAMTQRLAEARGEAQRLGEQLRAAGADGSKAFAQAEQAARLLQQVAVDVGARAAQALGVDLAAAGSQVSKEFASAEQNLALLIRSLPALQKAGVNTGAVVGQALAKMIDGARNQAEIEAIVARVQSLGEAGQISGAAVAGAFDRANAKARELKDAAEDAAPGIQSLGEAARKTGVDLVALTGGVSQAFKQSVQDVGGLVAEIDKTGVSAERASPVLAAALNKRIEAAQTKEELALVVAVIERATASGKLFGDELASNLDKVRRKAEELNPELKRVNDSIRAMGGTPIGEKGPTGQPSQPGGAPSLPNALGAIDPSRVMVAPGVTLQDVQNDPYGRNANQIAALKQQGGAVDNSYAFKLQDRLRNGDTFTPDEIPNIQAALRAAESNARLTTGSSVQGLNGVRGATADVMMLRQVLARAQGQALGSGGGATGPGSLGSAGGATAAGSLGGAALASPAATPASATRTLRLELGAGRTIDYQANSDGEAARVESLLRTLAAEAGRAGP